MPVGTRDPVDRIGASRERLLGERRYHRGEDEQREDPAHPLEAQREHPGEGDEPRGSDQHPEGCGSRYHHGMPAAPEQ